MATLIETVRIHLANFRNPHRVTAAQLVTKPSEADATLTLNYATHSNANDPEPGQKSALAGTSGTPGSGNKYVTDGDPRNTNARTPTAHDQETTTIKGAGTVWDDLPPVPIIAAKAGATAPTFTTFLGNVQQYRFAVNDEVFGATEILHGYKEGTALSAHIHWATNGSDASDRGVKWELEYSICSADGAAPFTEAFPATAIISMETTVPAGTASHSHIISHLGDISGTGLRIGAYILYRFRRITSAGTAPTANPFAIAIGFHVEKDTIGSAQVGSKT